MSDSNATTYTITASNGGTVLLPLGFEYPAYPLGRANPAAAQPTPVVVDQNGVVTSAGPTMVLTEVDPDDDTVCIAAPANSTPGTYYGNFLPQDGTLNTSDWLQINVPAPVPETDTWGNGSLLTPSPIPAS